MSANDEITKLESILLEREKLHKVLLCYDGASQRDPNFSDEDERNFRKLSAESHDLNKSLKNCTNVLRTHYMHDFRAWVNARNALRSQKLDGELQKWERDHLVRTTRYWTKYLKTDFEDFYRTIAGRK